MLAVLAGLPTRPVDGASSPTTKTKAELDATIGSLSTVAGGVSCDDYARIGSSGSKQQTPTERRACPACACLLRRRRSPLFENHQDYTPPDLWRVHLPSQSAC